MIHQFPYCVHVDNSVDTHTHILRYDWCCDHVGERGHMWHYPFDNTYRFKCEHDAIQFSLIWG